MSVETRNGRVLAYLRTRIGKATPRNSDIAAGSGLDQKVADAALYQLRNLKIITIKGTGNSRVIDIVGEGKTLSRNSSKARDTLIPSNEPEPMRVDNWVCRCGARNCTAHSRASLTTSLRAGWQRYAA